MKNRKYILNKATFLLFFAVLVLVSSCDLDESPKSFIAPETFYNTPAQIENVLAATMHNCYYQWGSYSYNPSFHRHTDQNKGDQLGGNLVIGMNHGSDIWKIHWANLKDLNFAIRAMADGKVTGISKDVENRLMGQLKFLRAWNYFQLVRHWGGLPLLTEEDTDNYFSMQPERKSVAEVYALIVKDFTEAIEKLPADWGTQVGRPSKDAAKGLLAKTYLTMATAPLNDASCFAKAAAMAKEVMNGGKYKLVENIENVFSMDTKYGPEMMWSFNANAQEPSTNPKIWASMDGWGDIMPEPRWALAYPDQPRKYQYLQVYDRNGKSYTERGSEIGIKKYLYDTWENYDRGSSTVNMPIIRFADVLLIFAEAENMSKNGPTQEAVDAVNKIIDRANGHKANPAYPLLTRNMTKEQFDKAVINERSYELCFEYDRWCDMVRKRIIPDVVMPEFKPNFSEADYLFPIPEVDIRLNPNMKQNPGY